MTLVQTPFGPIRGLDRDATQVFKGIRFATSQRFAEPQLVTGWDGEYDATAYQAQCHQTPGMMEQMLGEGSLVMSEDCLFLNVYTPACDNNRRPVLVWIHGGAFVNGSGSTPWYDGSALAQRSDVVVVTINYRLGAFGYLGAAGHRQLWRRRRQRNYLRRICWWFCCGEPARRAIGWRTLPSCLGDEPIDRAIA